MKNTLNSPMSSSTDENASITFQINTPVVRWGVAKTGREGQVIITNYFEGTAPSAPQVVIVEAAVRPLYDQQVTQMLTNPDAPLMGYVPRDARWGWYMVERHWGMIGILPTFANNSNPEFSELSCLIPYQAANIMAWWEICRPERKRYSKILAIECHATHLEVYLFSERGMTWADSQSYTVSLPSLHDRGRYESIAAEYIEPVWFSLLERGRVTPEQIQGMTLTVLVDSPFLVDWREFLREWFPRSLQNFFQIPLLPLTLIQPEKYLVDEAGNGCPHLSLTIWSAVRQFASGSGLDITQKLQPFLPQSLSPLSKWGQRIKELERELASRINMLDIVSGGTVTVILLGTYLGGYSWQLSSEGKSLDLRLQTAIQRQQDLTRIRNEIEMVRKRNEGLSRINNVLSREIPFQRIPSDFLLRLEENYVPGLVVRNYACEADNIRIQGLVRARMLAPGQRPADLVGQFVSRLEKSPGVTAVSPSIREVLTGDSPFEISARLENALPVGGINLPPLSKLIEEKKDGEK